LAVFQQLCRFYGNIHINTVHNDSYYDIVIYKMDSSVYSELETKKHLLKHKGPQYINKYTPRPEKSVTPF